MGTRASSTAKLARASAGAPEAVGGSKTPPDRQVPAAPTNTARLLASGLAAQQAQNWTQAVTDFNAVLELEPDHPAALYSLAAIESNLGQPEAALPKIDRVIALKPGFALALLARSTILRQLGQLTRALSDAELALKLDPSMPDAQQNRDRLLELQARKPVTPTQVAADRLCQQGLALQTAGNITEASAFFVQALELDNTHFAALYSLGVIASQRGESDKALDLLSRAAEADPTNPQGHFALATLLQGRGLFEAALGSFDRALSLNPAYIEAYNNKATLLHSMGRQKDALLTTEAGLNVTPDDHKLLGNKGYILTEFKMHALAASVFRRLLDLNPNYDYAEGLHAFARLHSCDWTDFEENRNRIIEGVREGRRVCNPLAFMSLSADAHDARKCAEIFAAHRFPAAKEPLWRGETYRHRRTRIAFLSADFREHPVGYLLIGLIEHFDKSRFETYGISMGIRDGSDLYRRYRNGFDHYLDCEDKTSLEIARLLRAMEIDVAIDLSGYTSGSRLDILSHRPAPVQMTYLGFPGGLGTPYIDYLIADRVTVPETLQDAYREKVLYLPGCYLPRDTSVRPAEQAPPREHFGLPSHGTVFCSFNHDYKINPPIFGIWMELLRENPGSVLWLMKLNEDAERNLQESAKRLDIDPKRLVFATRVPRVEDHLARYRHADVFLDTFPYNGHTTASDAIYAGVPVVTLSGTSFASRVAGSLLAHGSSSGVSVTNREDYEGAVYSALALQRGTPGAWYQQVGDEARGFADALADTYARHTKK